MNSLAQNDRFRFNIPLDIIKADDNGWQISGLASTEDRDLQGEIVRQNGLDISELKAGRGLFNYEHRNSPEDIVGMIEDAKHTDEGLKVDGYLFKKHRRAQAIVEIMQSLKKDHKNRVQLSIEGKVKDRGGENSKVIKSAKVERVAITFEPVNQNTYVSFTKSLTAAEVAQEVQKTNSSDPKEILATPALEEEMVKVKLDDTIEIAKGLSSEGAGGAPGTLTGGAALLPESLDGAEDKEKPRKKKKKTVSFDFETKKAILAASSNYMIRKYPDAPLDTILDLIKSNVISKLEDHESI